MSDEPCDHERYDWRPCDHDCPEPIINIDIWLARSQYSRLLCSVVKQFLSYYRRQYLTRRQTPPIVAWVEARDVEWKYHMWRVDFEDEAKAYVDVKLAATEMEAMKQLKKIQEEREKRDM